MDRPLHIPVILGTPREGRVSELVAKFLHTTLSGRRETTTELIDVRTFHFPHDGYGESLKDTFAEYKESVKKSDGFVIVTPEYNHGYPGTLKTLLDVLYPEYKHKAVAVVGVSNGPWGGVRVVENLTPVLKELGLIVSQLALNIYKAHEAFDDNGVPKDHAYHTRAAKFLDELEWLARTLRWGRNNVHMGL